MMLIVPERTSRILGELKIIIKIAPFIIQFGFVCNLQDSVRLGEMENSSTFWSCFT